MYRYAVVLVALLTIGAAVTGALPVEINTVGDSTGFDFNNTEYTFSDFDGDVPVPAVEKKVTTTQAPVTTTLAPPTTTVAPATTTVAPVTTTVAPVTTTVAPVTTTAAPVIPVLPPAKGKWSYTNNTSNITCVIVQMAVQFNISYLNKDNNVSHAIFDLPVNTTKTVGGDCGNATQSINLQWPSLLNGSLNNLKIDFSKNETANTFALSKITLQVIKDSTLFPNSNDNNTIELVYDYEMFSISTKKSYRCAKNQVLTFDQQVPANSTLSIKDLQMEAFATDKGTAFGYAEDCDSVDVPDVVPIAVGCALGGLVLIVLVTYLVGRRNRQARGYLSM